MRNRQLRQYVVHVNIRHLSWHGRGWRSREELKEAGEVWGQDTDVQVGVTDRLLMPIVATSKRHALTLAQKAWPEGGARLEWITYVGPCQEPE